MNYNKKSILIGTESLFFIYIIFFAVSIFLSNLFFTDILNSGFLESDYKLIIFLAVPCAILLIFIWYSADGIKNYFSQKNARLNLRVNTYFLVSIMLSFLPVAIILPINIKNITDTFAAWKIDKTLEYAENLTIDNYILRTEAVGDAINKNPSAIDDKLLAIEEFLFVDDNWKKGAFLGNEKYKLVSPPSMQSGFAQRVLKRDRDVLRFVDAKIENKITVYTFSLGEDFDSVRDNIEKNRLNLEITKIIFSNYNSIIALYLFLFVLPFVLMSIIMGINFSSNISFPIIELNKAARKVNQGDYSVQIYSNEKDEVRSLTSSFNAMVRSMESYRAQINLAENMSIWQNMARQLAHEIKNPLTPVKLSAERILRLAKNNPQKLEETLEPAMDVIIKEVDNLTSLLDEFRTLVRPVEIKKTIIQFSAILDECISIFKTTYSEVNFKIDYVDESINLVIDKNHLRQILNNLLINAIDATFQKGNIEISARLKNAVIKNNTFDNSSDAQFAEIIISDDGEGIDAEIKDKIFTPYWTSKPEGTGLGLPVVERIVKDYGGSIVFNSAKGVGTTFIVEMPCM